jgi:hypothetical protein
LTHAQTCGGVDDRLGPDVSSTGWPSVPLRTKRLFSCSAPVCAIRPNNSRYIEVLARSSQDSVGNGGGRREMQGVFKADGGAPGSEQRSLHAASLCVRMPVVRPPDAPDVGGCASTSRARRRRAERRLLTPALPKRGGLDPRPIWFRSVRLTGGELLGTTSLRQHRHMGVAAGRRVPAYRRATIAADSSARLPPDT